MKNYEKGFKLIEFLVVLGILTILAIFLLPKFIRARDDARIREVTSNIHSIQIACERYAVDTGGYYPLFLIGAEKDYNILNAYENYSGNGISKFPVDGMTPFAMAPDGENGPRLNWTTDPLIHFGYLSEYPSNPFANRNNSINTSFTVEDTSPGEFPYGGRFGDKMFDLGFGWGDTPQTDFVNNNIGEGIAFPDLDAPGNFYYHPLFPDGLPAYWHYAIQYRLQNMIIDPDNPSDLAIFPPRPILYILNGYGSTIRSDYSERRERFNWTYLYSMPDRDNLPEESDLLVDLLDGHVLNSSVPVEGDRDIIEFTGYPSSEFDPWIEEIPDIGERTHRDGPYYPPPNPPDNVIDWIIISNEGGASMVPIEFYFMDPDTGLEITSEPYGSSAEAGLEF